jgi:hypothetical protein
MLFKNSVRTSKRTTHFTITKINWLTLFKEIIAVYSEHHAKLTNTKYSVFIHAIPYYATHNHHPSKKYKLQSLGTVTEYTNKYDEMVFWYEQWLQRNGVAYINFRS